MAFARIDARLRIARSSSPTSTTRGRRRPAALVRTSIRAQRALENLADRRQPRRKVDDLGLSACWREKVSSWRVQRLPALGRVLIMPR